MFWFIIEFNFGLFLVFLKSVTFYILLSWVCQTCFYDQSLEINNLTFRVSLIQHSTCWGRIRFAKNAFVVKVLTFPAAGICIVFDVLCVLEVFDIYFEKLRYLGIVIFVSCFSPLK
ncbi:hypothetical protein ACOSP7_004862 [Xanthoceras sorbifolium]